MNEKKKALKQQDCNVNALKEIEEVLQKDNKYLWEIINGKKEEVEMLWEWINENREVSIENTALKQKIDDLSNNKEVLLGVNEDLKKKSSDFEDATKD